MRICENEWQVLEEAPLKENVEQMQGFFMNV